MIRFFKKFLIDWRSIRKANAQSEQDTDTASENDKYERKTVNEYKRANRISIISNKIALLSFKISALLFIITLVVFGFNIRAINAAQKSADAADSTVAEQKRNDSINQGNVVIDDTANARHERLVDSLNIVATRYKDSTDSIVRVNTIAFYDSTTKANTRTFELNKTANEKSQAISDSTLSQQEQSLKEAKNEFEKRSNAYVEITDVQIDTINRQHPVLLVNISNLGASPAKIDACNFTIGYNADEFVNYLDSTPHNFSLAIDRAVASSLTISIPIHLGNDTNFNVFIKGGLYFFIAGRILYENIITNSVFTNHLVYRIHISPYNEIYVQENYDTKENFRFSDN